MATVNFSVPDEVKRQFNRAFARENESRVVADASVVIKWVFP